ncbi:SELU1 [Auxenochlorella protothecoides x Auxenochlorella symbiontica]
MGANITSDTILKKPVAGGEFEDVRMGSLWADSPVLIIVMRRPGCILCREQTLAVWAEREKFEKLGVKLILTVHEWKQREIDAFAPEYWGGAVFYDPERTFYAAVHGGSVKIASRLSLLNPFSTGFKNGRAAYKRGVVKDSNFTGNGTVLGGVLVFKAGGELVYSHAESDFGVHPPMEDLVAGASKAAA